MAELAIPFILSVVVAYIGFKLRSLTTSGAIATVGVGIAVSVGFGYLGLGLLGAFFASSSLWSKFKSESKSNLLNKVEKGEQRDHVQVLANGSVPAFTSILYVLFPSDIWFYAFIASIAAANSDTWASELGSLSRSKPFLISNFKRVDPGTSGAVSLLGTFAGLAGSLFICVLAVLFWFDIPILLIVLLIVVGFLGNVIDTVLGVSIQVSYTCSVCKLETEKLNHCQLRTNYYKGIRFFNNDLVNLLSILFAAILGGVLPLLIQ